MKLTLQRFRYFFAPHKSQREKLLRLVLRNFSSIRRNLGIDYQSWIRQNEPDKKILETQKTQAQLLQEQTLFSIIVPVISPSLRYLLEMINSITEQTYQNWELCLVVDHFAATATKQAIQSCADQDSRIKIKILEETLGNAEHTNTAIDMTQGAFVGFLGQHDCLAPFALYEVVEALHKQPDTDVFYSDEDDLQSNGRQRCDPGFKPIFGIDNLRANNSMEHFLVLRKSLGNQIGWMRNGFEGAESYDLILRAVENARWVTHIPQVLYHIRRQKLKNDMKAAGEAELRAIREHLSRCNTNAVVEQAQIPTIHRIKYEIKVPALVSIIIPNHEHASDLQRCVDSILSKSTFGNYEIIIVENNSVQAETRAVYKKLRERDARIRVVEYHQQPFNYSEINNHAVAMAQGNFLLFLNNDVQVITSDWLERMLEYAIRPDVGGVGARLYFPNLLIQHTGVIVGLGAGAGHFFVGYPANYAGYRNNLLVPQNLSAVTAACLMMRRNVFEEIGGFDPKYRLAFGDIDLCLKARQKDYLVVCTPHAELIHYESMTRGIENTREKEERFLNEINVFNEKWADFLNEGDPFYNPNLSLSRGDFSVRITPCKHTARSTKGLALPQQQVKH